MTCLSYSLVLAKHLCGLPIITPDEVKAVEVEKHVDITLCVVSILQPHPRPIRFYWGSATLRTEASITPQSLTLLPRALLTQKVAISIIVLSIHIWVIICKCRFLAGFISLLSSSPAPTSTCSALSFCSCFFFYLFFSILSPVKVYSIGDVASPWGYSWYGGLGGTIKQG